MATPSRSSQRVRFGEFELDLSTRELRANGKKKQTLAAQPFQVLQLLIENRGQLVTRDALVRQLWPSDTFVDFEQGLKKVVNRLREALDDSAERPRFIETLPRQGYRFIAEVHTSNSEVEFGPVPEKHLGPVIVGDRFQFDGTARKRLSWLSRKHTWVLAIAVLIVFGAMAIYTRSSGGLPHVLDVTALTNDGLPKSSLAMDLERLYFVEKVRGQTLLSQISVNGGDPARIDVPFRLPSVLDYSSVQSALLVAGDGRDKHRELWVVPVPAGAPHRVGDVLVHEASWSHDGTHLVYTNGMDLWKTKNDGTENHKLATLPGIPYGPKFFPTSEDVWFTLLSFKETSLSLWQLPPNGKEPERGLPKSLQDSRICCGLWSQNGQYLFYIEYSVDQALGKDIWVIRKQPTPFTGWSGPVRLTNGPVGFTDLTISADGNRLYAMGTQARAEVVRYDRTSETFVPFLGGISADDVEISSDGQWVTYVAYPERTLWRSKLDGSERTQLTFEPMAVFLPRWSPDGTHIVFADMHYGTTSRIYTVSRDGGVPIPVLPDDHLSQMDANWSPDGNSIIFGRRDMEPDLAIFEVNLTTNVVQKIPRSEELTSPRLSPDGRYIVALSRDWTRLMLFDRSTEKWSELSRGGFGFPNWSADSKSVYARQPVGKVVQLNIADRQLHTVLELKDFPEPFPSWT